MTAQTKKLAINVTALVGAIVAVTGWAIRSGATAVDQRYVHEQTYEVDQAGYAAVRVRDSAGTETELRAIRAILSGLDSSDRCHRGYRNYCR